MNWGMIPFVYFGRKNSSLLRLVKCRPNLKAMLKICANGSSEMVNNISISIISLLYNVQLLKYASNDGIAAYGIMISYLLLYSGVILLVQRQSLVIIMAQKIITNYLTFSKKFSDYLRMFSSSVCNIKNYGKTDFCCFYLLQLRTSKNDSVCPLFFTALNNGAISTILSFSRVFLFQIPAIVFLPVLLKLDGIWIVVVVAELFTTILGSTFLLKYRKKYHY